MASVSFLFYDDWVQHKTAVRYHLSYFTHTTGDKNKTHCIQSLIIFWQKTSQDKSNKPLLINGLLTFKEHCYRNNFQFEVGNIPLPKCLECSIIRVVALSTLYWNTIILTEKLTCERLTLFNNGSLYIVWSGSQYPNTLLKYFHLKKRLLLLQNIITII